jgi:hypothetical protein
MHAGADHRPVSGDLDLGEPLARGEHRRDSVVGCGEDRHHPVAESLHYLAAVLSDRRLDRVGDVAEKLQGRLVARIDRPGRELDEVGEDDRAFDVAPAAALGLAQRLPDLERTQARLAKNAGTLRGHFRDAAPDQVGLLAAGNRERVAEAAVAREHVAQAAHHPEQALVLVQPLARVGDFLESAWFLVLGHWHLRSG